jgi:hypothetical protein
MVQVREDLTGRTFNRLTVIRQVDDYVDSKGHRKARWECECNCPEHNKTFPTGSDLKGGKAQSCGCLRIENASKSNKICKKKYNKYDLSNKYGVGWTSNTNKEFYFDLEDYDKIKDYCWSEHIDGNGYHALCSRNPKNEKMIKFHNALSMTMVDHINRNPLDNRKENLRQATPSENAMNRSKYKNNTSGVSGVCWRKDTLKWRATIQVEEVTYNLGSFINKEDAIKARLNAEVKYFGMFAPQKHLFEQYDVKEAKDAFDNTTE